MNINERGTIWIRSLPTHWINVPLSFCEGCSVNLRTNFCSIFNLVMQEARKKILNQKPHHSPGRGFHVGLPRRLNGNSQTTKRKMGLPQAVHFTLWGRSYMILFKFSTSEGLTFDATCRMYTNPLPHTVKFINMTFWNSVNIIQTIFFQRHNGIDSK